MWRQVVEYFDAFLIGLTATPSPQTIGFFNNNVVQDYSHTKAVADGINVGYEVYRIKTKISEEGGSVEAGRYLPRRDRRTRKVTLAEMEDDLTYTANQLDRDVVAPDQIRLVVRTFRDRLFSEIFPDRTEVPEDARLRQAGQPRRRHRQDRQGGVREGQRLLPEDHLEDDRRQAGGSAEQLPQLLQPAHRCHRGHDRDGHGCEAPRVPSLHAQREFRVVLRADEGPGRAGHRARRPAGRDAGRWCKDALS